MVPDQTNAEMVEKLAKLAVLFENVLSGRIRVHLELNEPARIPSRTKVFTVQPRVLIDKINGAVNTALADPAFKALLTDLGGQPFVSTPAEFGSFMAAQTEKWGKVIRTANIKPT